MRFWNRSFKASCSSPLDRVPLLGGQYTELLVNCDVEVSGYYPRTLAPSGLRFSGKCRSHDRARRRSGIGFQLAHCFGQGILRLARHGSSVLGVYRVIRSQTQARSLRISAAALPSGSCSTTPSPIVRECTNATRAPHPVGHHVQVALRYHGSSLAGHGVRAAALGSTRPQRVGGPAKQMSAVVPSARRSRIPGRSGISVRSAARAAARAELSECGAVSMIARSAPCERAAPSASSKRVAGTGATTGRSSVRWSPHPAALACGSRSMRTAR